MAGRVSPVVRVLLLPKADPRGIWGISKIILVLRLGQPSLLAGSFASLPAIGFCTEALPPSAAIVGKKQLVAVQALTLVFGDFHSGSKSKAASAAESEPERKKIQPKKIQEGEEGRRNFNGSAQENGAEEYPFPEGPF